jgi:hypothetical protein
VTRFDVALSDGPPAAATGFLGAEVQPVITAGIILAVVATLAPRGIAENFAAGVLIQTRRPIVIGDDLSALVSVTTYCRA